jgi:putative oxidoreductase
MKLKKIFAPTTQLDFPLLLLRLVIGFTFIIYGYGKVTGGVDMWKGIGESMVNIGINFGAVTWGFIASWVEFGGGILLVLGFLTRPIAFLMMFTMIMAAIHHLKAGDGVAIAGHAIELVATFIFFQYSGAGKYSIDDQIHQRMK